MATKKLTPADYAEEARRLADEKGAGDVEAALSTPRALGGPTAVQNALLDFRRG